MKKSLLFFTLILTHSAVNTLPPKAGEGMCTLISYMPERANSQLNDIICDKIQLFGKADFPVGVAINFQKLFDNENYRNLIISQFNSITPEKSMKAAFIHPQKETYNFSEVDYLMDFCKRYNKRLHGHTLVWFKENPHWMEKFKGDKNAWELMLKDHIQTIINHCKGNVKSWDVLNEAFNNNGSLKENIWLKNIGPDYIEKAFIYAAEADPTALLFYNDFDLESRPEKLNAVIKFLGKLKTKGVKIDGVGMQMHININSPYLSDINMAAMKLEEQGFLVHYSEFDISLVRTGKLFTIGRNLLKLQGDRTKEIVKGYRKLNSRYRFGITMWGLSDQDSWLTEKHGNDRPLLFDSGYNVKPAYCGFLNGLSQ
jgi:endo-1,4-beta-xylanase